MLKLYAKALFHKPSKSSSINSNFVKNSAEKEHKPNSTLVVPTLPTEQLTKTVSINARHCENYNALCHWKMGIAAQIHPNYIQTLSMPLQLSLMVNDHFPFKPIGVVHIANEINVHFLPEQSATITLKCYFGKVYFHKRGWLFELVTEAAVNTASEAQSTCIVASSYYLAKVKHEVDNCNMAGLSKAPAWLNEEEATVDFEHHSAQASFYFPANIGRRYANISGDFNPIHLCATTAKLFGFKQAIAHGMYSKALCVSQLISKLCGTRHSLSAGFILRCRFVQPILLPANTQFSMYENQVVESKPDGEGANNSAVMFSLQSSKGKRSRLHLSCSLITKTPTKKVE